jgi:hypothetical protein
MERSPEGAKGKPGTCSEGTVRAASFVPACQETLKIGQPQVEAEREAFAPTRRRMRYAPQQPASAPRAFPAA